MYNLPSPICAIYIPMGGAIHQSGDFPLGHAPLEKTSSSSLCSYQLFIVLQLEVGLSTFWGSSLWVSWDLHSTVSREGCWNPLYMLTCYLQHWGDVLVSSAIPRGCCVLPALAGCCLEECPGLSSPHATCSHALMSVRVAVLAALPSFSIGKRSHQFPCVQGRINRKGRKGE